MRKFSSHRKEPAQASLSQVRRLWLRGQGAALRGDALQMIKRMFGLYLNWNARCAIWLLKLFGIPDTSIFLHIDYTGRRWALIFGACGDRVFEVYVRRWTPAPLMVWLVKGAV